MAVLEGQTGYSYGSPKGSLGFCRWDALSKCLTGVSLTHAIKKPSILLPFG